MEVLFLNILPFDSIRPHLLYARFILHTFVIWRCVFCLLRKMTSGMTSMVFVNSCNWYSLCFIRLAEIWQTKIDRTQLCLTVQTM